MARKRKPQIIDDTPESVERMRTAVAGAITPLMGPKMIVAVQVFMLVDGGDGRAIPCTLGTTYDAEAADILNSEMEALLVGRGAHVLPSLAVAKSKTH